MEPKIHVHLHSRALPLARAFYKSFLGSDPVKEKLGYVKFLPTFAPLNLAISQSDAASAQGTVSHLGIQLGSTDEVLQHLARVKASGLLVREEMGVDCCHANQDKFWVRDPDGNEWEVYYLNYDIEVAQKAVPQASACCAPNSEGCGTTPGVAGGGN